MGLVGLGGVGDGVCEVCTFVLMLKTGLWNGFDYVLKGIQGFFEEFEVVLRGFRMVLRRFQGRAALSGGDTCYECVYVFGWSQIFFLN